MPAPPIQRSTLEANPPQKWRTAGLDVETREQPAPKREIFLPQASPLS